MNRKLIKWAAACVLSVGSAASALAGSVTSPGQTIGSAAGVPAPPGFYFANTADWGCRNTSPQRTCVGVNVPILFWSTPWTILGGRLEWTLAPITGVEVGIDKTAYSSGLFNPFTAVQLAWDLGNGWGFSYLLGAYFDINGPVAYSSSSLNQRFALSYTGDGWNLTANVIWGSQFEHVTSRPQISPCPVSIAFPSNGCNPDFINVDLTATKRFGRLELGPVGFFSSDLSAPAPGYQKQSQFAMGGLIGYWLDQVIVQVSVTSDMYERNYRGKDVRGWATIIIPIGNRQGPPAAGTSAAR